MHANWLISQMNRFRKAGSVPFELNPVHFFHILFSAFNHRALLISLTLFSLSCLEHWSEENRLREDKSVQRSTAFWVLSWVVGTHTIGKPVWLYSLTVFPCIVSAKTSFSLDLKGGKQFKGGSNMREETTFL